MATNTYVALDSRTLSTAVPSVTFSAISQAYTDLIVVVNATVSSGLCNATMNFGDTSTLYSRTNLIGNGSTAVSNRQTGEAVTYICTVGTTSVSAGTAQIMNYSNTNVNKTYFLKDIYSASAVIQRAGLWRNTNAISTIVIANDGGVNFAIGSTFTLYGVAAEGITPAPKATGGSIYSDSLYYYHVFGSTGVFTPTTSITADILVVAGGGGSGSYSNKDGSNGGSGGGANGDWGGGTGTLLGGTGTVGQGFDGGNGLDNPPTYRGGGGGGSGSVGQTVTSGSGSGNGGSGTTTYSSWATATGTGFNGAYAGGGGAGYVTGPGVPLFGAGQAGGSNGGYLANATNAMAFTGSGGGGGSGTADYDGGNGGSGLIIVRYLKA
jgi:hypothetical protein